MPNQPESDVHEPAEAEVPEVAETQVAETQVAETPEVGEAPEAAADRPGRGRKVLAVAAGVGLVGLLAGGAAGYLVGDHESGGTSGGDSSSSADLALPASLSGGMKRNPQADAQIKPSVASAKSALGAGTDMAVYTQGKTQILVEATRLPGQALLQAGMRYSKVGDAVCGVGQSSTGTEAICSRSSDALTVKVTALSPDDASKYADEVYDQLA